jgi:carbonic anhydrase/acetyltransferase-like protein (isoleucine patch superfamily)
MRFTFPTATISSISGAAYLASTASTVVAASVGLAYEQSSGSIRAASKTRSNECTFVNGFKVRKTPDTGILECGMGETCVEDVTSSTGGRCVVLQDEVLIESHRKLVSCNFKNGTLGEKCTNNACGTADQSKIGCGSCIGTNACVGWSGDITVGEGSCLGNEACNQMDATTTGSIIIGDGSCHDNVACKFNEGNIGSNSCIGGPTVGDKGLVGYVC